MHSLSATLSCSSIKLLFNVVVIFVLFCNTKAVITLPSNVTFPAVIAFGDSIVDTGNNNNLTTLIKCNFPPYGKDFAGKVPTGRFGNGKVPSDMIVEAFGIKELLPAYRTPNLQPQDLKTGVCFASGGAGYDPLTAKLVSVLSLSDQLQMFKEYIGKLKGINGEETTNSTLAKSLFLVVAGSDDIANTYFAPGSIRRLQYTVPAYTDFMVNRASEFLTELYGVGARRIAVFGVPAIGCVPSQRTLAGGLQRNCSQRHNQAAKMFNDKLSAKLDSLNRDLRDGNMVYIDVYNSLLDLVQNPNKYGFGSIVDRGCCGTGTIEVTKLCNPATVTCRNMTDYVFWDSYHPTEAAYKNLIRPFFERYIGRFF